MLEFIHGVTQIPGAVQSIGNVLINRIINQNANGFGDDPENLARIAVYKVLHAANDDIASPGEMFSTMASNPSSNRMSFLEGMEISDEAKKKLFGDMEDAQRKPLMESAEHLVELLEQEDAELERWEEISAVGQYVTAVRACNKLNDSIIRYTKWISEAEMKAARQEENGLPPSATSTPSHQRNLARLDAVKQAAKELPPLVDALAEHYKVELEAAKLDGVNIPERAA